MKVSRVALLILSLAYPLAVYLGLNYFDARSLALLLIAVAVLRLFSDGSMPVNHWLWLPLLGLLVLWVLLSNADTGLKLYPVLMNLSLLTLFAWSLKHPPTVVERMARAQYSEHPAQLRSYTTKVTKMWCAFFILNAGLSLSTSLWGSDEVWALYNGLIAYCLMAALFAGEWLVRQRVIRLASE